MMKPVSLMLLITVSLTASQQHQNSNNRWVWSRRDSSNYGAAPPPLQQQQVHYKPQQQFAQRRSAAIDSNNRSLFKVISARNFQSPNHPANIQDILKDKTKPSSPKDHKFHDVNGQKDIPKIITPGLYPYPFGAKPIDLGDGTSIGFAPQDTLPIDGPGKVNNGLSGSHLNQINEQKDETPEVSTDDRYTTLDKLNSNRGPVSLPDPHTYSKEILGGLHPDEVFYADPNLMIIKGGGFHGPYGGSNDIDNNIKKIKTRPIGGNSLGNAHFSELPTRVRPTEIFNKVPLPFRFVNGNIPTVVEGNRRNGFQQNSFRPIHHNIGFQPLLTNNFRPAASNQNMHRVYLNRDNSLDFDHRLQTLENVESDEILMAEPSNIRATSVVAVHTAFPTFQQHVARKRSANPKVVQYHYQTRGKEALPIVNYQVHKDGAISKGNLQITRLNNNRNSIPRKQKEDILKPKFTPVNKRQEDFGELEDLSTPEGGLNPLVPTVQTPKLKPITDILTTIVPISLRGDTDVNFLEPKPRANPLAESAGRTRPITRQQGPKAIVRERERQPSFFVPLAQPTPRVPSPSAHITQPQPSGPPRGRVPSVTRLRPQQTTVLRANRNNNSNRRFMEPRRRRPIRQKSMSPRV